MQRNNNNNESSATNTLKLNFIKEGEEFYLVKVTKTGSVTKCKEMDIKGAIVEELKTVQDDVAEGDLLYLSKGQIESWKYAARQDYFKNYSKQHWEQKREQQKKYYEQNKEEISASKKQYREQHKEEIALQKKIYCEKNKEKVLAHQKKYYEKNKEKKAAYYKQYYQQNRGQLIAQKKQNREQKKLTLNQQKNVIDIDALMKQYTGPNLSNFNQDDSITGKRKSDSIEPNISSQTELTIMVPIQQSAFASTPPVFSPVHRAPSPNNQQELDSAGLDKTSAKRIKK